jgi:hypothetical protein
LVVFVDQIEFFQDCGIVLKSVLANLESKKERGNNLEEQS